MAVRPRLRVRGHLRDPSARHEPGMGTAEARIGKGALSVSRTIRTICSSVNLLFRIGVSPCAGRATLYHPMGQVSAGTSYLPGAELAALVAEHGPMPVARAV